MITLGDIVGLLDKLKFWQDLKTLPGRMAEMEKRLALLEGTKARPDRPACPICETGTMRTAKVEPHPISGDLGGQLHSLSCENATCGHTETREIFPR